MPREDDPLLRQFYRRADERFEKRLWHFVLLFVKGTIALSVVLLGIEFAGLSPHLSRLVDMLKIAVAQALDFLR